MKREVKIYEKDCILCGICEVSCPKNAISVDRENNTWKINRDECIRCGKCVNNCPKSCLKMEDISISSSIEVFNILSLSDKVKLESNDILKNKNKTIDKTVGIDVNKKTCVLCSICKVTCPYNAIDVLKEEKTWKIDRDKCTLCEACISVCPKEALSLENFLGGDQIEKNNYIYKIELSKSVREMRLLAQEKRRNNN